MAWSSFAGLFFDVVVYTIWLKRRTPWGIVLWGGISGGMPVAGRARPGCRPD
jgi:heme o synthase